MRVSRETIQRVGLNVSRGTICHLVVFRGGGAEDWNMVKPRPMTRIIAVTNQKGGVGKTTTVVNLGAALAAAEMRVLVVDVDPQANCTSGLGYPKGTTTEGLFEVWRGEATLEDVLLTTEVPGLSLIPGAVDLAALEMEGGVFESKNHRLRELLTERDLDVDVILMDCPPSLGLLTVNALVAAHEVLIPLQAEYYALEGMSDLLETVDRIRGGLNPTLELLGILMTMVDERTNLARQVTEEVLAHFREKVFSESIPRNIRLAEAPSHGQPILIYDIMSRGAQSYLRLAREVLARGAA